MKQDTKEYCRQLIYDGFTITIKDVTICDLRAHMPHRLNHSREYQVASNDFLDNYRSLEEAILKFEELVDKRISKGT